VLSRYPQKQKYGCSKLLENVIKNGIELIKSDIILDAAPQFLSENFYM